MKRETRARIYFRLMDIMLVLSAIGFAEFLLDKVGGIILIPESSPIHPPVSIFFITMNFFVPLFLILARFMRDEYAELLWQRTVAVLAYFVAVAPIVLLAGAWSAYYFVSRTEPVGIYVYLGEKQIPYEIMLISWMTYMLLFVAIFQFLRWRDSR